MISDRRWRQEREWFQKMGRAEREAQKEFERHEKPKASTAKNRKELILEKLNALPDGAREKALREFEQHEYFSRNEYKHTAMIRDIPHPDMALDENGDWVL